MSISLMGSAIGSTASRYCVVLAVIAMAGSKCVLLDFSYPQLGPTQPWVMLREHAALEAPLCLRLQT